MNFGPASGVSTQSIIAALRLARYFGMSVEFWTGIQTHYEVELAKMELENHLEEEVKVFVATYQR